MHRHLASGRHQLIRFYQPVDPAQLVKPFGREPKGECQLGRRSLREAAPVSVIVAAQQPALGLRGFEHGAAHRDAQVGTFYQVEAATHRKAVDRSYHGLFERSGAIDIVIPSARCHCLSGLLPLDRLLHIFARAESAPGTCEDGDLEVAAVAKLDPRRRQLRTKLRAQRIKSVGPVHAHHHYTVTPLDLDNTHSFSFFAIGWSTPTAPCALIAEISAEE